VVGLVFDPAASTTLFVATRHNGVFKTVDAGVNWTGADTGLPRQSVTLAIAADGSLYCAVAGAEPGLFRSADAGTTWQRVLSAFVTAVATDLSAAGTVYVGTAAGGVFKTTNGGGSWTFIGAGIGETTVRQLIVDPMTPTTLYLGTGDKAVFKSTDGGASWEKKDKNISGVGIESMIIDPISPANLFIASSEGLFKSTDGAESWQPLDGTPPVFVTRLALDPQIPSDLYAGTFGSIFASTNGGTTWSELGGGIPAAEILLLAVDPVSSTVLYAGTGSGVAKSSDGGAGWTERNSGLRSVQVECLAVDPGSPETLYAASSESGIFKSTNGGASWQGVNQGIDDRLIQDLALAPSQPQNLYAAQLLGLRRSQNGGSSWTDPVGDPGDFGFQGPEVAGLAVDPVASGRVFAANGGLRSPLGGGPGVLRSIDAASSWERVFEPEGISFPRPGDVVINPFAPDEVVTSFSGQETGSPFVGGFVFRSLDGGDSWDEVLRRSGSGPVRLVYDSLSSGTLFALRSPGEGFEVLRSADGGDNWALFPVTVPCVNDLLPDPAAVGTIWIGCDPVYVSEDGGAGWSMFDATGFPVGFGGALALAFDPGSTPRLYAGTEIGVYSYSFPAPADLAISKDDGVSELDPGESLTYTVQVRNLGPEPFTGGRVIDVLPADLTCSWSCVPSGGASCTASPPAGDLDELVDLPVSATVTFTADCVVGPAAGGFLVNTATASAPESLVDPDPSNNSASDTDVVLEIGPCGVFNDRFLSDVTFDAPETVEACNSISAGPGVIVAADVTFRAPEIRLFPGFRVVNGDFTAVNESPSP
jgi:uncharacterized repeat protein (TIGR01451 family)